MPRQRHPAGSAHFFHVINRSVRLGPIFARPSDYRAFLAVLDEGAERYAMRLMAYCILGNHWHLLLGPSDTAALSGFMRWVTSTHAGRWHHHRRTVGQGPVYQSRFHSVPIGSTAELVRTCRYVERNALTAGLVRRAQDWPWCSLAERLRPEPRVPVVSTVFLTSSAWIDYVNAAGSLREELAETARERRDERPTKTSDDVTEDPGGFSGSMQEGQRVTSLG